MAGASITCFLRGHVDFSQIEELGFKRGVVPGVHKTVYYRQCGFGRNILVYADTRQIGTIQAGLFVDLYNMHIATHREHIADLIERKFVAFYGDTTYYKMEDFMDQYLIPCIGEKYMVNESDYVRCMCYDDVHFTKDMAKYMGEIVTVKELVGKHSFRIEEDNGDNIWHIKQMH